MRRLLVAVAVVATLATVDARPADAGTPSRTLTIAGAVEMSRAYDPAALTSLPQAEVTLRTPDGRVRVYRGVLLRDLLAAAKPTEAGRFDLRQSLVVARATDGYVALFTWQELVDTAVGDGVLVATTRDGSPLADDEGAFALVSAADRRSGPRHVRRLESLDLRRITR